MDSDPADVSKAENVDMTAISIPKFGVSPETIATLQSLIRLNIDSCSAWEIASEHGGDGGVRELFIPIARLHRQFTVELQVMLHSMGEAPAQSGTIKGAFHRGWFSVRCTLAGENVHTVLVEAGRHEDSILEKYDLLQRTLGPGSIDDLVSRQRTQIYAFYQGIRMWKAVSTAES